MIILVELICDAEERDDEADSMVFICLLSWSDRRSAHGDLQSDCSASSLHDRRLHDVAQPFHHWNDLPLSSSQCVTSASVPMHPFNKDAVTINRHASIWSGLIYNSISLKPKSKSYISLMALSVLYFTE